MICYSLNVKLLTDHPLSVKERKETEITVLVPRFDDAPVVREAGVEVLGMAELSTRLLADSDATGGALSVMRTTMGESIEGTRPHTHHQSAELFYLLDGQLQLLAGSQVLTAGKGDLVVIPPDMAHAFATPPAAAPIS